MFSIISGLIISVVAIFFAFQNNETVTVRFLENELTASVALVFIGALFIGFLIGMIVFVPRIITANWRSRSLNRENERLKSRLNEAPIQYEAPGLGEEGEGHIELK